jgi:uncharacterized membrane protein YgcG
MPVDPAPVSVQQQALRDRDILQRLFANGTARSTNPASVTQFLSFSFQATRDNRAGLTLGTLFFSDSINNVSVIGAMQSGNIVVRPGGGGTATFRGIIGRQRPFTLTVEDRASATQPDTFTFDAPGVFTFSGAVIRKDIQIVRAARPMRPYNERPAGTTFAHDIGMWLLNADFNGRKPGPQQPIPTEVIELVPPEPIIDFQRNRLGGQVRMPGSENNQPGAIGDIEAFVTPYYDPDGFPRNNQLNNTGGTGTGGGGNSGGGGGGNSGPGRGRR